MDKFLIYKLTVSHLFLVVVHILLLIKPIQPVFPIICFTLIKTQINFNIIMWISILEINQMMINIIEVFLSLFISRCPQPFVILCFPWSKLLICHLVLPIIEILNSKKWFGLMSFSNLKNRSNELSHKLVISNQLRPKEMDEIYY